MLKLIFAFAAACVFTGCTAAPMKETSMHRKYDGTISLLPQTSTTVAPDATLRFDRIDDSRCPPDVRCITAGKIVYHFTLIFPVGVEPFMLEPAAPAYTSTQQPDLIISLATDPPAPLPTNVPPGPPQAVILNVSHPPAESR
ncbi:hypothetical protein [Massilia pseudoviolaceinigra]|uniref:hypothetical protein n=1 Tax=Massilia pseudoviolaceinigra TaxID=3057165 RepID=UPI002796563A|nr:hypothetical protein [Massilia sp. CCM 9206]MDQ1922862.1 hypothetical protein [Massilia sp. CCM 9206]